jgi:alanyl-tRNA synthetase
VKEKPHIVSGLTEKLFHDSPYDTVAEAMIESVDIDERSLPFITLTRTLFYPQGGGQKGDRGTVVLPSGLVVSIGDTRKEGDIIRHYPSEEAQVEVGTPIEMRLDWESRYQQMRIHSASHLIHCFMEEVVGKALPPPRQSPLGPEGGENHYDYADLFDESVLNEATGRMNAFVAGGSHEIVTMADESQGTDFRWWKCEDWSIPCGGVHPKDAAEIGEVETGIRVKKGKARIEIRLAS